ncbi:MAG: hypothetical protein VR67_00375 [Peptococcaceae bacterium BRH_c8a]|nr:MAG: hypothetical protein VR67_05220 [Peptococcaceae bacterium BRH_c8a]KJS14377.1 MAG: hypothetical protein VR67_00375 [Peptococcaceae bacterium BRH_c8a]
METARKKKKLLTRRNIIIGAVILVLVVVAVGVSISRGQSRDGIPVTTAAVEKIPLGESVFTTGRVQLADKQELYAYSSKLVREIKVKPGDTVKKGQVLGYLESGEEEIRLKEAEAGLALQQAEYDKAMRPQSGDIEAQQAQYNRFQVVYENAAKMLERTEYLYEQGAVTALELESAREEYAAAGAQHAQARLELDKLVNGLSGPDRGALTARVEQSRAGVEIARQSLAKCILTADRDGTVLTVEAAAGDLVSAGARLITVGDVTKLEVTAGVGESDSGRLKPGQQVIIVSAALPEREFEGTVAEVAGAAVVKETSNGQQVEVPLKVTVNPGAEGIRPGYTVDLKIITVPERTVLTLPYEAILDGEQGKQVFVVQDGLAQARPVTTGLTGDLFVEVMEGLQEGDVVILSPGPEITDAEQDVKVRAIEQPGGSGRVRL